MGQEYIKAFPEVDVGVFFTNEVDVGIFPAYRNIPGVGVCHDCIVTVAVDVCLTNTNAQIEAHVARLQESCLISLIVVIRIWPRAADGTFAATALQFDRKQDGFTLGESLDFGTADLGQRSDTFQVNAWDTPSDRSLNARDNTQIIHVPKATLMYNACSADGVALVAANFQDINWSLKDLAVQVQEIYPPHGVSLTYISDTLIAYLAGDEGVDDGDDGGDDDVDDIDRDNDGDNGDGNQPAAKRVRTE